MGEHIMHTKKANTFIPMMTERSIVSVRRFLGQMCREVRIQKASPPLIIFAIDLQHNMFVRSFDNRLALAPPNDPGAKVGRVLDCGTGSGIWAIEFAEDHPESEVAHNLLQVIGVDLSATVPAFTPPNVKFEVDDVEEPWIYSQKFDYIHSRMMTSSIGDWRTYLQRCYDNLNPGGYLELIEVDGTGYSTNDSLNKESATERCLDLWRQAAEILGHPFQDIRLFKDIMLEIGFEDIHVREEKWPSNPWPKDPKYKELGAWNFENFSANIEGFIMAPLTRALNWTKEECLVLAMEVRKEMRDPKVHYWMTIMSIYGRKPENKEE
ncbi:uncharacterized protein CTRU02_207380 [Colletotrichum truncatum]|uniref:Uncharacterized protein n=1 Tax=Colletotrichum truncatum TaxID=5467 RepID=A0ACC3Z0Q0_COLTU